MTIEELIRAEDLPADYNQIIEQRWIPLAAHLASKVRQPSLVGINGAQGSGKSTLCKFLEVLLAAHGVRAVTLSLDDLYLGRAERQRLTRETHPLFITRGVPGTHDPALGMAIIDALLAGHSALIPRFDKAADDRAPGSSVLVSRPDVILFEGWCVGAVPQAEASLRDPINALEREEDPDGRWRSEINRRLATDYARLFERIDHLVMLQIADFEGVRDRRMLQERKLARLSPGGAAVMNESAMERFIMHYERLTRHILWEMPARADIVIPL